MMEIMERKAKISRKTSETDITLEINIDGEGNYGYLGADGSLIPFSRNTGIFIPISGAWTNQNQQTYTYDASSYDNGMDISKANVLYHIRYIFKITFLLNLKAST